MTYGNLIAHCENINGNCLACEHMADCKSYKEGIKGLKPCYISRLWNEEIKPYTNEVFANELHRKSKHSKNK